MNGIDTKPSTSSQRSYGRGYHDGLHAGIDMNNARLAEAERGLSGVSRKVFDAVPKTEAWTVHQIAAEIHRAGARVENNILLGCLNTLKSSGLVREPEPKLFQRVAGKAHLVVATPAAQEPEPTAPRPEMETPKDTLAKLAELSVSIRDASQSLSSLAGQIDDIAIEVEERIGKMGEDSDKLRQLQTLLRSIGG